MKKIIITKVVPIAIAIVLGVLFLYLTDSATISEWYSPDLNYRFQTDAFLKGDLEIRNHPYEHGYDWVWGNGIHQNWGLGVPMLRLPFEAAARVFGVSGFPDRLVFLFYFAFAAFVFLLGVRSIFEETDQSQLSQYIESLFITLVCFISPTLVAMTLIRFHAYEEAAVYNCIWAFGLIGLLIYLCYRTKISLFLIICFLAGFSPLIRPTGLFYGLCAVGLALYLMYRSKVPFNYLIIGLLLFGVCPFFQIYTNYLRFGEFFEFGYHRILDLIPALGFMLKFGYPFTDESFFSAVSELFGSLFLVKHLNGLDFFKESIHGWQANFFRFREYYFPGFSLILFLMMLIGWAVALTSRRIKVGAFQITEKTRQVFLIMGLWSIFGFIILFFFYLKKPAFSSRYAIDFLPALAVGTSVFLIFGMTVVKRLLTIQLSNILIGVFIVVWVSGNGVYASWVEKQRLPAYKPTAAIDLDTVDLMKPEAPTDMPDLPALYSFETTKNNYNIPINLWGWYCYPGQYGRLDPKYMGMVGSTVTLFLGPLDCIELRVKKWRPELEYDMDTIQVKVGTQLLVRKKIDESNGIHTLKFCPKKPGLINKKWNMVTIAFVPKAYISSKYIAKVRLLSVKALQAK